MQSTKPIIADCLKLFLNVFLKSEKIKECFSKVYFLITLVSPAVAGPIRIINIRTQILPEINAAFVLKILLTKQIHARTNGIKKIEYSIFASINFQNLRMKISPKSLKPFFLGAFFDIPAPELSYCLLKKPN